MRIQSAIEDKLRGSLAPVYLEVANESHKHRVPPGSESHFRVVVVSAAFEGKTRVARHRLVNKALAEELADGVHALAMATYTPEQWQAAGSEDQGQSPPCAHQR